MIQQDLIILMSYFPPVIKGLWHRKFNNPLTGMVYNNQKYASSCIQPQFAQPSMPHKNSTKCKSIPYSLFKQTPNKSISIDKSGKNKKSNLQFTAQKQFKLSKIMSLTKRLSDSNKIKCTRNKWNFQEINVEKANLNKAKADSRHQFRKYQRESQIKVYKFPQIKALILNLFNSPADHDKVCKLSLKNYFELFFKESLSGTIFKQLAQYVQKYIEKIMLEYNEQEDALNIDDLDNEYSNILSKKELYTKMKDLQAFGKQQHIIKIIKAYCIPTLQIRNVFMKDLIDLINIQLYQTFNCNKNNQYVLLNDKGQLIEDFAQIKFSTVNLFIAESSKPEQYYERYLTIIHNNSRLKNRFQFRQLLKIDFRQKVVKGNYQANLSPQKSVREEISEKRNNLNRAHRILNFKNQKNSSSRTKLKVFVKEASIQKDSRSKSRQNVNSPRSKQTKNRQLHYTIDKKTDEEFKILKNQNYCINTRLKNDQNSKEKIELQILVKESIYFKNKTLPQIQRILNALGFIEKEDQYQQYYNKLIGVEDYSKMRKIIDCVGQRQNTIRFIDRYLGFDQYGELQKDCLNQTLAFIVGNQGKTADIILNTIWIWLQKNGVISNLSIRRLDMQIMYERNKLVYYFLISLIFGTNEVSVLQLTQDILI